MTELTFVVAPEYAPAGTVTPIPPKINIHQSVPVVEERVTVRAMPVRTTHLAVAAEVWGWEELRDYVVSEITKITGAFPRNPNKEMGIFKSFVARYGADAAPIAKYAFGPMKGYWKGAPVSVSRFCKGSDPYFADPILQHLNQNVR